MQTLDSQLTACITCSVHVFPAVRSSQLPAAGSVSVFV